MVGVVPDGELAAAVDGKWAKQSRDAAGQPLAMVNVLAHDLKLCLAQWPLGERRYEPAVLRSHLAQLFHHYPGLELLTMDALYVEQDLCQAIVSYGGDYLVRVKGNRPAAHRALTTGFAEGELGAPQASTVSKRGPNRGERTVVQPGNWPTISERNWGFPGPDRPLWRQRR